MTSACFCSRESERDSEAFHIPVRPVRKEKESCKSTGRLRPLQARLLIPASVHERRMFLIGPNE